MEQEELQYLNNTTKVIKRALERLSDIIKEQTAQLDYLSNFYVDQFYSMDQEEIAIHRLDLDTQQEKLALAHSLEQKLLLSQQSPYFGRIDFLPDDSNAQKLYIGITGVLDKGDVPVVCDWRAPASSMYYDFGKGRASYNSPMGEISGQITLKRQYKIKNQKLEYYFDSDINIDDEILQEALSSNRSEKLTNIVSTIQTEQNKVIRNDGNQNLLVQGYAGSGKTTVALHRVAYLLYRYKDSLTSDDIAFISPSEVFSDYISNVLPQLGENMIPQITFEGLCNKYLKTKCETRLAMLERIIKDPQKKAEVCFKESFDFCENLIQYLQQFATVAFEAKDFVFGKQIVPKQKIQNLYFEIYKTKDIFTRIDWIADFLMEELQLSNTEAVTLKPRFVKILYDCLVTRDVYAIYNDFLQKCGLPQQEFEQINYDDLAALLYINGYLFGFDVQTATKHLVIDEMQDYSPLEFLLFKTIYPCPKTIVGDIYQSLYKDFSQDYLTKLAKFLGDCKIIKLDKTYRSTKQINEFAFNLLPQCKAEFFNRDGAQVDILPIQAETLKKTINDKIQALSQQYQTIAIITKTQERAKALYYILDDERLTFQSDTISGIPIMSIGECRGLEFDAVITILDPPLDKTNKSILFVASTRALHKLVVLQDF